MEQLSDRQKREIEYNREHRTQSPPPPLLKITHEPVRWWNAYWHTYSFLRGLELRGKSAMVIGCGYGNDPIFLDELGAQVWASDLSRESLAIAKERAGARKIHFGLMPAERLDYPDNFFDLILCVDVLHHTEVAAALREIRRVAKPGAWLVWDEMYRHTKAAWLRKSPAGRLAREFLYRWIYAGEEPYVTVDEVAVSQQQIREIAAGLHGASVEYFDFLVGQLVPERAWTSKLDRRVLRVLGSRIGSVVACRCTGNGQIVK